MERHRPGTSGVGFKAPLDEGGDAFGSVELEFEELGRNVLDYCRGRASRVRHLDYSNSEIVKQK